MLRPTLSVVLLVLTAALVAGCAGSGVVIADGRSCGDWLDGNGRDAYLQAHGLAEYDADQTGRRRDTAAIAQALTDICAGDRALIVDEALRRAADRVSRAAASTGAGKPP